MKISDRVSSHTTVLYLLGFPCGYDVKLDQAHVEALSHERHDEGALSGGKEKRAQV